MEQNDVWRPTDQAPVGEWVLGYWSPDEYDRTKYTHERGWVGCDGGMNTPPLYWSPFLAPDSATSPP